MYVGGSEEDDVPRQNDSCMKMGSDEIHFNVSLTVRDKVTRQVFTDHTAFENLVFSACVRMCQRELQCVSMFVCVCIYIYI